MNVSAKRKKRKHSVNIYMIHFAFVCVCMCLSVTNEVLYYYTLFPYFQIRAKVHLYSKC